eukprot:COSAG02_NODE_44540_length_365_cov_0.823308_1_plen_22_part_10
MRDRQESHLFVVECLGNWTATA